MGASFGRWLSRLQGIPLVILIGLASGSALAAPPLDPPQRYTAHGRATATVSGPNCCGETQFTGRFHLSYELEPSGDARLGGLAFDLDDSDVWVHGGFLGLFSQLIAIRCGGGSTAAPASGRLDSPTQIKFPAGAIQIAGGFSDERLPSGECTNSGTSFAAANPVDVSLVHRPDENLLMLEGTFAAELGGASYVLQLQGTGLFDDRPPQATLAFRYPDGTYPQAGCPAYWRQNDQKLLELVAEANSPAGLVANLVSFSGDPDGGRADIVGDRWFDTRGSGSASVLGEGNDVGPLVFDWGLPHRVELLSFDRIGAPAAASCSFRVIDSRPPVVTPPVSLVTSCSTSGGATPGTSARLTSFLGGARAFDVVDASPSASPPILAPAGTAITSTTLFPADGAARGVSFRFRDGWGNTGSATSTVTVLDTVPPSLSLSVNRPQLNPDYKFWSIAVTPAAADDCGGPVSLRLASIRSNAPALDGGDILDASYGVDDRAFYLFSRPAAPGVKRVYTITYRASDAAGNTRFASVTVTVGS